MYQQLEKLQPFSHKVPKERKEKKDGWMEDEGDICWEVKNACVHQLFPLFRHSFLSCHHHSVCDMYAWLFQEEPACTCTHFWNIIPREREREGSSLVLFVKDQYLLLNYFHVDLLLSKSTVKRSNGSETRKEEEGMRGPDSLQPLLLRPLPPFVCITSYGYVQVESSVSTTDHFFLF